jgi:DNA-binding FrmR family transcriptional regulator
MNVKKRSSWDQIKNRLKRVEDQIRGVLKMMEEEQGCKDVVMHLSAVRNAIDRAISVIVSTKYSSRNGKRRP